MSEHEGNAEIAEEPKPIEMLIILNLDGSITVKCPMLQNKLFCYGLLESAKLAIIQTQLKQQPTTIIQPAKGGIVNFIRGGKRF